jgi:hypothetical protein
VPQKARIRIPNNKGEAVPESLGGKFHPAIPGSYSNDFLRQLREANPGEGVSECMIVHGGRGDRECVIVHGGRGDSEGVIVHGGRGDSEGMIVLGGGGW